MREVIEITLSIVLGLVFLASAIPKLRRPHRAMCAFNVTHDCGQRGRKGCAGDARMEMGNALR